MLKKRVAVMISGRGSNMTALINAAQTADYPAEIVLVLSNRPEAHGLTIAHSFGIATQAVDHLLFKGDRIAHETVIDTILRHHQVDIVCLAGYMRLLTGHLVHTWQGRMLNIHPSLLPDYPGLQTHRRVLAAGDRQHGCTVHVVTEEMDVGPIVAQAMVPVLCDDTEADLENRVLHQEHWLYPYALKRFILDDDYDERFSELY